MSFYIIIITIAVTVIVIPVIIIVHINDKISWKSWVREELNKNSGSEDDAEK